MRSMPRLFLCLNSALALFSVASTSSALAQDSTQSSNEARLLEKARGFESRTGLSLWGALGAGYGGVSSNEYTSSPTGGRYLIEGLASWKTPSWVFDGGLGWFYSRNSGAQGAGSDIELRTREGLAELSPRYRLGSRWQLGPVLNLAFGADTTGGATYGGSTATLYAGGKAVYELPFKDWALRFFAQVSTDLSVRDRQTTFGLAGIQIGLPIGSEGETRPEVTELEDRIRVTRAAPDRKQDLTLVLDPQQIFFGTNSANLKPDVAQALNEVGEYLKTHPELWGSVEIGGHADQRGRYAYNLKLSGKRAKSVAKEILESGVSPNRVQSKAYSYSKPIKPENTPEAWALNRRVEIVLKNVLVTEELLNKIKPLARQMPAGGNG